MEASNLTTEHRRSSRLSALSSARTRLRAAGGGELAPPALVAAIALAFMGISLWWILNDHRLPNGDNGKHLLLAFGYHDTILAGFPLSPLAQYNLYPPLVHYVGAFGSLVSGPSVVAAILSENLVFVPLLALGCYGAGRIAFGPWAGAMAAAFAFASPMIGSLFHVFMLDGPTTAMVAVTVWGLLASDRFSRVGVAALAGVAAGAGMYAKSTFPLFLIGILAVMMLRGGWRNWRGWLAFGGVWFAITAPWYVKHWSDLAGQTKGAAVGIQPYWYGNVPYPSRFSLDNFTWYGWNLVNNQLYLPLTIFLAVGIVYALWSWLARKDPGYAPELLAGGAMSYVAISFITLDDPRYTLPGLVYAAVLGTGWIVRAKRPVRVLGVSVLVAVLILNTVMLNFAFPAKGSHSIELPNAVANPIASGQLVLSSSAGYIEGQPDPGPFTVLELLERARADGARRVMFQPESLNNGGYNLNGLGVFARDAGLAYLPPDPKLLERDSDIFVFRLTPTKQYPHPCIKSPTIADGTWLYIQWGPTRPKPDIHCPR